MRRPALQTHLNCCYRRFLPTADGIGMSGYRGCTECASRPCFGIGVSGYRGCPKHNDNGCASRPCFGIGVSEYQNLHWQNIKGFHFGTLVPDCPNRNRKIILGTACGQTRASWASGSLGPIRGRGCPHSFVLHFGAMPCAEYGPGYGALICETHGPKPRDAAAPTRYSPPDTRTEASGCRCSGTLSPPRTHGPGSRYAVTPPHSAKTP